MHLGYFPLLSIIIFLPLFGAFFVSLINESIAKTNAKYVAIWSSLVALFLTSLLWVYFDFNTPGFQFIDTLSILPIFSITYKVGVDGLTLAFVSLTAILFPLLILASWNNIKHNLKLYVSLILMLESFLLCAFCSLNLLFFYLFCEACLLPLYFLIGLWGIETKTQEAPIHFMVYNLIGSLFLLSGIIKLYVEFDTFDLQSILHISLASSLQIFVGIFFLISFLIRLAIFPFHAWLPFIHAQSSAPVSMALTSMVVNLASYGMLRFLPTLFPDFLKNYSVFPGCLALFTILYASWIAFKQIHIKKMMAYAAIAQGGFVLLGVSLCTVESINGALLHAITQGAILAGLFFCTGVLYNRIQSFHMDDFGGLTKVMPIFATLFFIFSLGLMGMPLAGGFTGKLFIMIPLFKEHLMWGLLIIISMLFTSIYMLWLYRHTFFGIITGTLILSLKDLDVREKTILIILSFLIIGLGIYPKPLLKVAEHTFVHRMQQ